MGVLCHAFPGVFCNPADAPSGTLPFTDGTLQDASQFDATFPYLQDAAAGLAQRRQRADVLRRQGPAEPTR